MTKDQNNFLEQRLEEWARWAVGGFSMPGIGYSKVAPGFSEYIKHDRAPVVADDREVEIERAVGQLAKIDRIAAEVIRAEYHAHPRYGHAHWQDAGNACKRTYRQLGIGERTYRGKLEKAKAAVWVAISVKIAS